jgi:ribonuclease P protein component
MTIDGVSEIKRKPSGSMPGLALTRLKKRPDFLKARDANRKFVTPAFIVQVRAHGEGELAEPLRIGFTVTKKVGNSVVRNRVRRRLRAAVAETLPGKLLANHDLVLIGRVQALVYPYENICKDLLWAARRLKITASDNKDHGRQ